MSDKYPRGKFNKDDEGQIAFRVGVRDKTVILDFGKPVAWIGMPADAAVELAMTLLKRAREAGVTKPITIEF